MDANLKFTAEEFANENNNTVSSLPDVPSARGMTAAQLKARFDNIGKVMIALGKHNDLVDAISNGLETYAMQVKPYLADNTDLDTVRTNGVYPGYPAYTYTNRPADSSGAFWLYVSSVPSTGYTVQVFISLINGRVWIRNRGGAWTAWKNYLQSEFDKFGLSVVNNQICITY